MSTVTKAAPVKRPAHVEEASHATSLSHKNGAHPAPAGIAAHHSSIAKAAPKAVNPPPVVPAPLLKEEHHVKRAKTEAAAEAHSAKPLVVIKPLTKTVIERLNHLITLAHGQKDSARALFVAFLKTTIKSSKEAVELKADEAAQLSLLTHILKDKAPGGLRAKIVEIIRAQLMPVKTLNSMFGSVGNMLWNAADTGAVETAWALLNPVITESYQEELAENPQLFKAKVELLCRENHFDIKEIQSLIQGNNWRELMMLVFKEDFNA